MYVRSPSHIHKAITRASTGLRYSNKVITNPLKLKPRERERDRKDSKRVEAKRKCWGRSERNFISGGGGDHLIVRRFPGSARSSF
jgi:hypothetical protein